MPPSIDPALAKKRMILGGAWPIEPYPGSGTAWKCVCLNCGELCTPTYKRVYTLRQGPCNGLCRTEKISKSRKFSPAVAAAIMRKGGWEPLAEADYPGANSPWSCRCTTCKTVYPKQLGNVRDRRAACRNCIEIAMSEGAYDVMIAADLEPQVPFRRSAAPWLSKCLRTGALTSPAHSNIKRFGHQCVPCGLRKMSAASQHSDAEARSHVPTNLVPQEAYPGSVLLPWKMFCTDCETLHDSPGLRLSNVSRRGSGCPNCGHHGIELGKPGYLYLIVHTGLNALKWGIANGPLRLKQHSGQGWARHGQWMYDKAIHARSVERQVDDWVKGQGIDPPLTVDQMPYGGYSETASLSEITVATVLAYMTDIAGGSTGLLATVPVAKP